MAIDTFRLIGELREIGEAGGHVTENVTVEPDDAPATTLAREPGPLLLQFVTVSVAAPALGTETTIAETRAELRINMESPARSRAPVRKPRHWVDLVAHMKSPFSRTGSNHTAAEFNPAVARQGTPLCN